jgi:uncharacterized protein YgbK (DUF1537 family)
MERTLLCIIADDLTGAFDAAAPFAARGQSVVVALHPGAMAKALSFGCDVVAVSTQSREISADEAASRVAEIATSLPAGVRLFKKVDSRLKGNVGAELAALAPRHLLVAPAIPEFGRIVRNGLVSGFGIDRPISVAEILGDLGKMAVVPDTSSTAEMQAALMAAPSDALLVGARGLADALAAAMTGRAEKPLVPKPVERILMVVGSRDPITVAQVAALRAQEGVDWHGAPNGVMAVPESSGKVTVVQATPGTPAAPGNEVADALAESVHPALTARADAIFLTGGATAEAVLRRMALDVLQLEGEVLPGVPLARAGDQAMILKSGGFGEAETLIQLVRILRADT